MKRKISPLGIALVVGLLGGPFAPPSDAASGGTPTSVRFDRTGGLQNFVVPPGVTVITIEAVGAAGGSGCGGRAGGGKGASAKGTFAVPTGASLAILAGGEGGAGANNRCGGGGGGGASLVWECNGTCATAQAFSSLLVAAGGGGGGGAFGPQPIASPGNDGNDGPFGKDGGNFGHPSCCLGRPGGYGGIGGNGVGASGGGGFSTGASGGGGGGGVSNGGSGGGNGGAGTNGGDGVTAPNNITGGAGFIGSGAGGYGGGGGGGDNGGGGGGGGYGGGGGGGGYFVTQGGGGYGGGGGGSYVNEAAADSILTAGVGTGSGYVVISYILPDLTPPVTTAAASGTSGDNGWYISGVSVTLTAIDEMPGSGVSATHYAVDGGAQQTYGAPFSISGDGSHPVAFWSVDNDGNTETAQSINVSIDTLAPAVSCGGAPAGWSASDVSVACTASDATSGLKNPGDASFQLSTSVPSATETSTASTNSRVVFDRAGLSSVSGPVTGIRVDKKPPVVACAAAPAGWQAANVAVSCSASDGGSGLANASDASFSVSTSVAAGTANGNASTGTRQVCDAVGLCANAGPVGGIQVDRQSPASSATTAGTAGTPPWFVTPVTVTLSADDGAGSGVAHTYYSIDGGLQQLYSGPVVVAANGLHAVAYWSVDGVGNAEAAKVLNLAIDSAPPSCSASASPDTIWPPNRQMVPVTITVQAAAGASGVAGVTAGPMSSNEALSPGDVVGFNVLPGATTPLTVSGLLRADRNGKGNGRSYSQNYTVTSGAGATAGCTATIFVPHDSRR